DRPSGRRRRRRPRTWGERGRTRHDRRGRPHQRARVVARARPLRTRLRAGRRLLPPCGARDRDRKRTHIPRPAARHPVRRHELPLRGLRAWAFEGRDRPGLRGATQARESARACDGYRGVPRHRPRPLAGSATVTSTEISYGKARVVFYRLAGREAPPLAASVDIDVFGERFISAY